MTLLRKRLAAWLVGGLLAFFARHGINASPEIHTAIAGLIENALTAVVLLAPPVWHELRHRRAKAAAQQAGLPPEVAP